MLLNDYRGPRISRLRAEVRTDRHGDPVEDWTTPVRFRFLGASVQPVSTTEEDGTTRFLVDERTLFVRGRPDLVAADRVEIEGEGVWRVSAPPVTRYPFASRAYTVAALSRVSGGAS